MTSTLERWLTIVVLTIGRILPTERREWLTAMIAEAGAVPAGRHRLGWLLGAVPLLVAEVGRMRLVRRALIPAAVIVTSLSALPFGVVTALVVLAVAAAIAIGISGCHRGAPPQDAAVRPAWIPRMTVLGADVAIAVLTVVVGARYPQVFDGAGTPYFIALLMLLLAANFTATWVLSRATAATVGPALIGGVIAATLWTGGVPAGGAYDPPGGWPTMLYDVGLVLAFAGPPVIAAALVARRHDLATGIAAGALTGSYAALGNLVGGLVLVMSLPGRVPVDVDVLARYHTATEILGADVGEDLAGFVILMIGWPAAGLLLGCIAAVLGSVGRGPTRPTPGPGPTPSAG